MWRYLKLAKKLFREVSAEHVQNAMTWYLRSISAIDDDESVTHFKKIVGGLEVKVEKDLIND